jgi:predicted adenine nucleotide alpha hydrolase (AANH) superfamily ATPase
MRVAGKGALRCEQCYRMRLDAAGSAAREFGLTAYTTSLLYSKYQKHDLMGIAVEMASEHGIESTVRLPARLARRNRRIKGHGALPPAVLRLHLQRAGS